MSKGSRKRYAECKRIESKLEQLRQSNDPMSISASIFYANYLARLKAKEAERFK